MALHREFVEKVERTLHEQLSTSAARLTGVGLAAAVRDPRVATDEYEYCVEFVGKGGIADVIEFYIVKDGKPVASLTEISDWFADCLTDVVRRAELEIQKRGLHS